MIHDRVVLGLNSRHTIPALLGRVSQKRKLTIITTDCACIQFQWTWFLAFSHHLPQMLEGFVIVSLISSSQYLSCFERYAEVCAKHCGLCFVNSAYEPAQIFKWTIDIPSFFFRFLKCICGTTYMILWNIYILYISDWYTIFENG